MPTISTTPANKQAITRTVTSSVRSHIDELVLGIEAILYPTGVPQGFDLRSFFVALADTLDRDYNVVADADREVAREVGEDQQARNLRDEHITTLRESLFQVRALVNMALGTNSSAQLDAIGLSGRVPDRAEPLVPFARNVAEKLAALQRPASTPTFVQFDVAAAAADLRTKADALDTALTALARDVRETQAMQNAHSIATSAWQRHYTPIARIIEGSFLLADMNHQAERVRPTSRRNAGRPEDADLGNDDTGTGSAPDPVTDLPVTDDSPNTDGSPRSDGSQFDIVGQNDQHSSPDNRVGIITAS